MQRFALTILVYTALILLAIAVPRDASVSVLVRDKQPSQQALGIAETSFSLLTASESGCAGTVTHDMLGSVPDDLSGDVEGIVTHGNITVDGATCDSGRPWQVMRLYSQNVLDSFLPADNLVIASLSEPASRAVFMAGIDLRSRKCGVYADSKPQVYAFTNDIMKLVPSLVERGFIDTSDLPENVLEDGRIFMISGPLKRLGRVCLYRNISAATEDEGEVPEQTEEGDASEEESDTAAVEDEDMSDDEEQFAEEGEGEEEAEPGGPGTFETANDEGIQQLEEEATEGEKCFPVDAIVTLENGSAKQMRDLGLGDKVLVTSGIFSEVFMFTHRMSKGTHVFLKLDVASGDSILLTAGHYLYINGHLSAAEAATVGDSLELADGTRAEITCISRVSAQGLFNPQTMHGDIIVNNVRASTYTTAVEPSVAHALLAPLRAFSSGFTTPTFILDNGANALSRFLPRGQAMY